MTKALKYTLLIMAAGILLARYGYLELRNNVIFTRHKEDMRRNLIFINNVNQLLVRNDVDSARQMTSIVVRLAKDYGVLKGTYMAFGELGINGGKSAQQVDSAEAATND